MRSRMSVPENIGEHIKKLREDKLNISQKNLARFLKITPVYMSYLEKGKKTPSLELLENIYKLAGQNEVPDRIKSLLSESRLITKKQNIARATPNVVYLLEERGLYDLKKLKKQHETHPNNLVYIFGILTILIREQRIREAEQHLLQSLMHLENPEDKKWLQALYHKLQGDLDLATGLMNKALEEFNKRPPGDNKNKVKKARLLFQLASFNFDMGQKLYQAGKNEEAKQKFMEALKYHQELRNLDYNPYYQMDYSGIFFWLAFLGVSPKKNWERYIEEAKSALALNFYIGVQNFPSKEWKSVYSKPFIIATVSFLARAYGQLAILEKDPEKKLTYLNHGEFLLIQNTPVDLRSELVEYYRFYFNCSSFYSLKAEIKALLNQDYDTELHLCEKFLNEALNSDVKNNLNLLYSELNSPEGLEFFKKERKEKVTKLLKEIKKRKT
jgi:transcriptional regulator with XRE-family HTH domain